MNKTPTGYLSAKEIALELKVSKNKVYGIAHDYNVSVHKVNKSDKSKGKASTLYHLKTIDFICSLLLKGKNHIQIKEAIRVNNESKCT